MSGNLNITNGQPNEVITLLFTSNNTPWTQLDVFDEDDVFWTQQLNSSNTVRIGTVTLDSNGYTQGLYWSIGIPTCSCKVTITGRSGGLPIPSANSTSFTIIRP